MMKFDATGLFVKDMAAMVTFYKDVMGMQGEWDGGVYAQLHSGEHRLMFYPRSEFEKMTNTAFAYPDGINGTLELAFDVGKFSDVDQEYDRLIKAGAPIVFPPTEMPWGQRTAYVTDPDGNLIELSSFVKDE